MVGIGSAPETAPGKLAALHNVSTATVGYYTIQGVTVGHTEYLQ